MPLYEFKCEKCNHVFDQFLNSDDRKNPLSEMCPECGEANSVFRLYSSGGFIDPGILNADKNMEKSGVLSALERIRDNSGEKMVWKG